MGACGCADTSPEIRLPGPEGVHYGIEIYPGCQYCYTPAGVVVYRFDDDEAEIWLMGTEEAEFQTYLGINGEIVRPVLEARFLAEELADWREDEEVTEGEIQQALPQAVWKTLDNWNQMKRENA
jgi:hypothetical protein